MELLYASPYSRILSSTRLIAHDYSLCMLATPARLSKFVPMFAYVIVSFVIRLPPWE